MGIKLTGEDTFDHCNFVLNAKMREPQFAGQTKESFLLETQQPLFLAPKDSFSIWLNQNTSEAELIANLAIARATTRLQTAKSHPQESNCGPGAAREIGRLLSPDADRAELFLVEGDSAGGSAKQARDRDYQAILPLRGKILNTWEVDSSQVLASETVHDIAQAIAVDPGSDDLSNLRYNKICILADADSDGLHIATLICDYS